MYEILVWLKQIELQFNQMAIKWLSHNKQLLSKDFLKDMLILKWEDFKKWIN